MFKFEMCVSQLCMVSLSLFQTLLSLNCEDVMLQLILRYLYISAGPIKWFFIGSFITDGIDPLIFIILAVCVIFILFFCVCVCCSQVSPAL